jgi:PAS domain S-box-containing protein
VAYATPLKDGHGNPCGAIHTLVDITERKEVEETLIASENRFRAVFEQSEIGIALGDMQGRVIANNPALEHMLGYGKGELKNKFFGEFTHPEDITLETPLVSELKEGKRDFYEIEKRYIRKDGQMIWVKLVGSVFKGELGQIFGLALIENITERKKADAEIAYKATFPELNPSPIVELDPAGNIVYMNPSAKVLFPNLQALGIVHPYLLGWHALTKEIKAEDMRYNTRDIKVGDTWYEQVIARVPSGQTFRIYGRDITVRKKADELKDEFIGMVSHELKTPLTVIMGALATATDPRITPEDAKELLGNAVMHSGILANLVDNLLELSRQQSDRLVLSLKAVNIGEVTQNVLRSLQSKSEIHRLISDVPLSLAPAQADPLRVERILYNLIDNAIKYSPGGGEVKVTARQNGDFLTIGVSDNGPGISAIDQAKLFQSFERLGATVKGAIQGTGLGLRVCRILVEAHGGIIWVESEKDKGSTFMFTLPIAKPQA